jgi:FG-GAP repeat
LRARRWDGEIVFVSRSGAVRLRYGELGVVDASGRRLRSELALSGGRLLIRAWDRGARYPLVIDPLIQLGTKLVGDCVGSCSGPNGTGETGAGQFGLSVAMSGDGNTALVGTPDDSELAGAAWVFTRSGSTWSAEGSKLVGDCAGSCSGPNGTGENVSAGGYGGFGSSVALSRDGKTALIGAPGDNGLAGAAWIFTRSGSVWSQQGPMLVGDCTGSCSGPNGTGEVGGGDFGTSVALSGNGDTALIGGRADQINEQGAAWVFTRSGSRWSQQGAKLVGDCTHSCSGPHGTGEVDTGGLGGAGFGITVALADDGDTALIGAFGDSSDAGAAWVFTRSGSGWSQQGAKLVGDCTHSCSGPEGTGEISLSSVGGAAFGRSVALSGDGNTALIGAPGDDNDAGAAWVFTRAGSVWNQQGSKLVGDCTHSCSGPHGIGETGTAALGISVALSSDGTKALIGAWVDRSITGAAWVFKRSGSVWNQQGAKLVGDCTHPCPGPHGTGEIGRGGFGTSGALSGNGGTALIGAPSDNRTAGAAWVLTLRLPSNQFAMAHIRTDADGRTTFAVTVPGPGIVDVLETAWNDNLASSAMLLRPAAHRFAFARAHTAVDGTSTIGLSVLPNARGRLLVRNHTYPVTLRLWVTYTPRRRTAAQCWHRRPSSPPYPDADHDTPRPARPPAMTVGLATCALSWCSRTVHALLISLPATGSCLAVSTPISD